jgi:hypothetical protein
MNRLSIYSILSLFSLVLMSQAWAFKIKVYKIKKISKATLEVTAQEKLIQKFKFKLYKPINSPAKGALAVYKVISGDGRFQNTKVISDQLGYVNNDFTAGKTTGVVKYSITSGKVSQKFEIKILPPVNVIKQIESVELSLSKKEISADNEETVQIEITLKTKDSFNLNKLLGLIKVSSSSSLLKASSPFQVTEGKHKQIFKVGKHFGLGKIKIELSQDGFPDIIKKEISLKILPKLSTVFVLENKSILNSKQKISLTFKAESEEIIPLIFLKDLLIKDSKNKKYPYTQISENIIELNIDHPLGLGTIDLSVLYKEKVIGDKVSFNYKNIIIDPQQVLVEQSHTEIAPHGIDDLFVSVQVTTEIDSSFIHQELKLAQGSAEIELEYTETGRHIYRITPKASSLEEIILIPFINNKVVNKEIKVIPSFKVIKDKYELVSPYGSMVFNNGFIYSDLKYDSQIYAEQLSKTNGFSFSNEGGNVTVPTGHSDDSDPNYDIQATREYIFTFEDQAKQNMSLTVADDSSGWTSRFMLSQFIFLPRNIQPHLIRGTEDFTLVLPTGESVKFNKETNEINSGVLEEGPIDLGPSRYSRKFANIRYKGTGVVIRINGRGQSPELGQFSQTKISGDYGNSGAVGVLVYYYDKTQDKSIECYIKDKGTFWQQKDVFPIPFIFPSDKDIAGILKEKCGEEYSKRILSLEP